MLHTAEPSHNPAYLWTLEVRDACPHQLGRLASPHEHMFGSSGMRRFHPRREKPAFAMKADIDREHSPDHRDSQNHRSRREPLSIDDSDEGVLAASIIERRRYDAMLPGGSFVNRSRLRLILDLMVGIPFLLILLGIDVLRRK